MYHFVKLSTRIAKGRNSYFQLQTNSTANCRFGLLDVYNLYCRTENCLIISPYHPTHSRRLNEYPPHSNSTYWNIFSIFAMLPYHFHEYLIAYVRHWCSYEWGTDWNALCQTQAETGQCVVLRWKRNNQGK